MGGNPLGRATSQREKSTNAVSQPLSKRTQSFVHNGHFRPERTTSPSRRQTVNLIGKHYGVRHERFIAPACHTVDNGRDTACSANRAVQRLESRSRPQSHRLSLSWDPATMQTRERRR